MVNDKEKTKEKVVAVLTNKAGDKRIVDEKKHRWLWLVFFTLVVIYYYKWF